MTDMKIAKIYRFKISNPDLYNLMIDFANTNQFLDKSDLKDKYEEWLELPEINKLIIEEQEILRRNEYNLLKTNIKDKIFKSIKYYHIKNLIEGRKMKLSQDTSATTISTPISNIVNKNNCSKFSQELIQKVKEELSIATELKPSICCKNFMTKYSLLLNKEKMNNPCEDKETDDFDKRFKKMFKNQWFMKFKK